MASTGGFCRFYLIMFLFGLVANLFQLKWISFVSRNVAEHNVHRRLEEDGQQLSNGHLAVPNLLRTPSCPGPWQKPLSWTPMLMEFLITGSVWLVMACISRCFLSFLDQKCYAVELWKNAHAKEFKILIGLLLVLELVLAVVIGVHYAASVRQLLPELHFVVYLPKHWQQLLDCHIRLIEFPEEFLPVEAGANLKLDEQRARRQFYVSLLLWILLVFILISKLLTWLARFCRATYNAYNVKGYERLEIESGTEDLEDKKSGFDSVAFENTCTGCTNPQQEDICVPLWLHGGLHLFCALLSVLSAIFNRLSVNFGVCWEIYVLWVSVILMSSFLYAFCLIMQLPGKPVPDLTAPLVLQVLPVFGEPLDVFKDWLFIGLALSLRTWISGIFAAVAVAILYFSNVYMRQHYGKHLVAQLTPIHFALSFPQKRSFIAKQTSPGKLATAILEDFPQACLQSVFVCIYGGSVTQILFIGWSCTKIVLCLSLRATVLEWEERFGESYETNEWYYRQKFRLVSYCFGPCSQLALESQQNLAGTLIKMGRNQEAFQVLQQVVEGRSEVLGSKHLETLKSKDRLGYTLAELGKHEEACRLKQQVVTVSKEVLGLKHLKTLAFQRNLAFTLCDLGKLNEALELMQGVVATHLEILGRRHVQTLKSRGQLARVLRALGQLEEAVKLTEDVMAVQSELLGPKHPSKLRSQDVLASMLYEVGRYKEALEQSQSVLTMRIEVLGPKHPETLQSQEKFEAFSAGVEPLSPPRWRRSWQRCKNPCKCPRHICMEAQSLNLSDMVVHFECSSKPVWHVSKGHQKKRTVGIPNPSITFLRPLFPKEDRSTLSKNIILQWRPPTQTAARWQLLVDCI